MTMWTDTHAHLAEPEYDDDREAVIQRAKAAGLGRIVLIGCGITGAQRALALAETDELFNAVVGFHPEEVLSLQESDWSIMEALMRHPKVIAIGEIGLDFYWDKDPAHHVLQEEVFLRQMALANTLNKPVVIHSRDAIQRTHDLLKKHPVKRTGIMHCYSGSLEMAKAFIKLGYFISLAGPVTFKNAHVPVEVALGIDTDHLLIETDSPYLAPHPYRGKRNEPAYVKLTAERIASLKNVPLSDLEAKLEQNYNKLFNNFPCEFV
jgi:TatD DNase family protein